MRALTESEVFDDYARETSVAHLRHALDLPPKPIEHNDALVSPMTIGIEIEENWRQALPELGEKWAGRKPLSLRYLMERPAFTREYREADEAMRARLSLIAGSIPASNDSYHEFSFYPAKNLNFTKAEIDALYEAELLRNGQTYALHMTVGGIDQDYDAYTFLSAQELSGASTPARILGATTARQGSWSQKGIGGIKIRQPHELLGGDTRGHEFRSLCVTSHEQLVRTLGNAVRLAQLYTGPTAEWQALRHSTMDTLRDAGLPLAPWNNPKIAPKLWERYARILDERAPLSLN